MLSVTTHFGLRICISKWESIVVAGMCLTPVGAISAPAPLEAGFFRWRPLTAFGFIICDSCNHCYNCPGRWRWCPRKDQQGLRGALNLGTENFYDVPWQTKARHAEKLPCLTLIVKPSVLSCSYMLFPGPGPGWQVEWLGWRALTQQEAVDAAGSK